ncbi:heparin lyase I family protein [Streptomyces sp. NBC_01465]|uniref:heparin lyase I family protein n=1 Tax=Streptomyces sp. NBC_01465 TaxID=2903878 RepID=UPI002E371268|nr:heparin lyase I family protein [Streptomyces sp. NBC_01465]
MMRALTALALAGTLTATWPAAGSADAVVLDVNYQDGSLNSGIAGLTTTHATSPDASAVVPSGEDHAVSHKVTLGDPGYVSDGAPRSESATNDIPQGVFHVGDTRRYEFSVLLKDWKTYEPGDSESGDIIFQGKHAGGNWPSFYLMTKRNSIAFRSPTLGLQSTVVEDFRPQINRWMRFRVDVRWTDDATGYYKVSARLPGEQDFTLRATYENVQTFHPRNPTTFGYIKWGLYRPSESIENGDVPTRVVYHDDIRIQDLGQAE